MGINKRDNNLQRVKARKQRYEKLSNERIIHFLNLGVTTEAAIAYKQVLADRGITYPVVKDEPQPPKVDRQELIELVQKLLDIEGTFDEEQQQWEALQANFLNWLSVLRDIQYVIGGLHSMTAEEIVDKGLTYKPI